MTRRHVHLRAFVPSWHVASTSSHSHWLLCTGTFLKCCLYKCSYLTCWSARLQPAAGASSGLVSRVFLFFLRVFTTYFAHFSVTTGFDFQRTSRSIVVAPSHAFRWHFDLLHCFCSYICYRFVFCTMVYMSYASIRVLLVIYIYLSLIHI